MGRPLSLVFEPDHVPGAAEIEALSRESAVFRSEKLCRNKAGERIPVLYSAARMSYADRRRCDYVCVALDIRERGGVPMMWKTGHSLIKARLKETGAPIAGEMSGHIFFGERWYSFDDATYTAARLLEILSRSKNPSAVLDALPTSFSTPELNVPCAEGEPQQVIEQLRAQASFPGAREVITIDGLRAEFDDGFGLVRASNTTPVLVLRFEGHTPAALERIQTAMLAALRSVKPDARIHNAAH